MAVKPQDTKNASIGDRLWIDTNGNGVQDGSEAGLGGVTIQLLDSTGALVATTISNPDGSYLFDGLAAGIYQLQFGSKDGYGFTSKDSGIDSADSDANVTNGDGIQNDGATGVADVTVTLKNAAGTTLATTTGADGSYLFDHLAAGQYQVQFGNKPGYTFTGQDKGTDDANDSDANATTGLSQVVSLGINQQVRTVDAGVVAVDPHTSTRADGSSIAMVDAYFQVGDKAETTTVANKLAQLMQPADDLLHNALGHSVSEAAAQTAGAVANIDGGEVVRQMLASWNAHHNAVA
jgi:hypothetical protein